MNTPYDFKYHAEIMYETLDGFNFCNANGNTVDELLWDIHERFDYYEHRGPKLVCALLHPNTTSINVTKEIIKQYNSRGG